MSDLRQSIFGVLAAFLLAVIVIGSLALSMAESGSIVAVLPEQKMDLGQPVLPTLGPFLVDQIPTLSLQAVSEDAAVSDTIGDFSSLSPTCMGPSGWALYIVMPDDTPVSLAQRFGVSLAEFSQNNCLAVEISSLLPGTTVYVPLLVPVSEVAVLHPIEATAIAPISAEPLPGQKTRCGPPSWWSAYSVRWGDTLSNLAISTGVSIAELRQANCMGGASSLRAGQNLFLPFSPAIPVTSSQVLRPVATPLPPTPSPTYYPTLPYSTPQATEPPLPTEIPTEPPAPTAEPTEEPLPTVEPTDEPLPTVEPTEEPLPTVEPTEVPLPTDEPTEVPLPTDDPTEAPIPTADPTEPPIPSVDPTEELVPGDLPAEAPVGMLGPLNDIGLIWPARWLNSLSYLIPFYNYRNWIG